MWTCNRDSRASKKEKTVKAAKALDLRGYGVTVKDLSKLQSSIETEEGEKGRAGEDEDREVDSGTHLSARSNKGDVEERSDDKLTHLKCARITHGGRRQEARPAAVDQKRLMVYTCGGSKDTVAERRAFMETVYPRLYLYCKQRGYDFRMLDLRWGVGAPVAERHDTVELHVENLRRCQETRGPHFILFVGQESEGRSLPSTITREAFEAIVRLQMSRFKPPASGSHCSITTDSSSGHDSIHGDCLNEQATSSALLSQSSSHSFVDGEEAGLSPVGATSPGDLDSTLLQMYYKLDENCRPSVYRLLPISWNHPDVLSVDRERRTLARKDWGATCRRLWDLLQRRAAKALGGEAASKLLRTVLDWEVETGLQTVDGSPPEEHCHCYKRLIPDLDYSLENEHVGELDPVSRTAQQQFLGRLYEKLRHTNIHERYVGWGPKGLNPKHNRSYQFYIQRISSHFQRTVSSFIDKQMTVTKTQGPFDSVRREAIAVQIQEEIQRHVNHALNLGKGCTLRQTFLADLKREVEQPGTRPILLLGPPGSGKSTIMAAAAQLAPSWLPGAVKVLVHFIGFTGESRNIRLVLQSLCVQLAEAYCPHTKLSEGFPQLINEFHALLGLVGVQRPLVVLLDGLDELSEEHHADLSWVSTPLPPNVHLIMSATTHSPCIQALQSASVKTLALPPLSLHDITAALEMKLHADGRCLQEQQWQLLVQACRSCPCPLYLEGAYAESTLWASYTPQASLSLPGSLQGLYLGVLERLERELGRQLVRRAASLISISRWGVTEEELLYLLAQDEKVLEEVTSCHHSSDHPGVPYVLWARMKHDLGHHLTEVRTDGTFVYRWTHSELSRVCTNHYLRTEDARMAVHADYADYYRDKSHHSHIFQPLAWTLGQDEGLPKSYRFNLRKLRGLPYHLVRSGQILPFLTECIFNYEFLLHKAWGLSILDIEEDLSKAVLPDRGHVDVEMLSGALEMSRTVLLQDPCQLASQLLGRLGQMISEDRPVAKGDPLKFSYLHSLQLQCTQSSLPVLLPSSTCLLPPGDLQHSLLAGHLTNVTALGGGQRGPFSVTSESDGRLRFWDVEQRRIIRSMEAVGGVVADSLILGLDDKMLIVCMGQRLQVREVESGRVVYSESDSVDVPIASTTCEGQLLVVFYDGSDRVKVFDLASSCSLLHCVHISIEPGAIHRDCSILLSSNSVRDYVLFTYRSGGEAAVFSAKQGVMLSILPAQHAAASIRAVEMTEDYLLLFCRYPYKRGSEIIHIELFSTASFLYLRSILGCSQDSISQVSVNRAGTHAVAFCPSPHSGITELVTWNLETEDHKHVTRFPAVLTKGLCLDLCFCLGICRGEKYLYMWDLTPRITDETLTYNTHKPRSDGTEEIIPMGKHPRYVVCRSIKAGAVYVWNLARRRFACRPVRVEHGLYSATDVVLAHDLKLYILTDRSSDTPSYQFQTLLVYDLITRSYVRRQTGMAVVLCPQHEYRLLEDGQLLLGLSETRDRLILWDLDSGSIKHEIKPSHRKMLVCSSAVHELQPDVTPCRDTTLMPRGIQSERQSAKKRRLERDAQREEEVQRRLDREKDNTIDQYLLSGNEQVLVCSYFAHHLNVFSVASQEHLHTLEDKASLLSLHSAAVTHTGSHLVLSSYNQHQKLPCILLWDLHKGTVRKKLRNEAGVCCVAVTDDAHRVAFGATGSSRLKVWEPFSRNYRSIAGYGNLMIEASSELHMVEGGAKAVLLSAAGQLSLWDLEACSVLSVLSLDGRVSCMRLLHGREASLLLGLGHSPTLIGVRSAPTAACSASQASRDSDLFGESSSSEEEEEGGGGGGGTLHPVSVHDRTPENYIHNMTHGLRRNL